jgi:hypothetical protein
MLRLLAYWLTVFGPSRQVRSGRGVLCVGIFIINFINVWLNDTEWANFRPLYVFVMIIALGPEALER